MLDPSDILEDICITNMYPETSFVPIFIQISDSGVRRTGPSKRIRIRSSPLKLENVADFPKKDFLLDRNL